MSKLWRRLSAALAATALSVLALGGACSSADEPALMGGAGTGPGASGTAGTPASPGNAGTPSGPGAGDPPDTCVPGIPATSQVPRLLNRHYEAAVRDLLGIAAIGPEGKSASQLLVADSDGAMAPDAWRIYRDVGAQIAREVMTGSNRASFIRCDPAAAGCLEQTIRTFGRKAFRRPLTDAEVARFQALGQTTPPGSPDEVAETTLLAFLVSPSFLLVPELTPPSDLMASSVRLSSHEVATRLSLLLWGSVPDDALNAAADADQLQTKDQILAQAQRMIAVREKTGPLLAAFHREWIQMNNGNAHWWKGDHDPRKYPLFSPDAKASLQAELDAFFQDVAFGGGSFESLFLSQAAFVNRDNAAIYGLDPSRYGTDLIRVELDAARRPGFMTRAGFLSSYSSYDATSPILRGAFISVYMLGVNPGAPIPGATMMTVDGDFETQRAYVEALTKPATCTGCHRIINPPGFVMENYDAIGAWQNVDPRGGTIDASVTTATVDFGDGKTKPISSALELMQEIARTPKSRRLYAQAWVSYAYGRDPNAKDRCVVDRLDASLSESGYGILDLLADLTQADSFRSRVRETP